MIAIVLAGCGSEGVKFDPPPPQAVASCALVEKYVGAVLHNALWFDSAGHLIQVDGQGGSSTYEYDDQGRMVHAKTRDSTITWTYEPARITEFDGRDTDVLELDGDGRVMHREGPEESAASDRITQDFTYDAAGHITSLSGGTGGVSSYLYQYSYDAEGRLTSATHNYPTAGQPTFYSYTETPGHLMIALGGQVEGTYTYDFDASNRIVHAGNADSGGTDSNGVAYSYVDDRITATSDSGDLEVESTGLCPAPTTTFGPYLYDPLPIRPSATVLTLPNPLVDLFNEDVY